MDFYSFIIGLVASGIGIAMSCISFSIYLMLKENQDDEKKKENRKAT
jgi:hypothetical protein